jgi:hypothetical protein
MIHFQAARHRFFQLLSLTENIAMTKPSAGAEMPPPAWQMSACLEILDDIQEQIRFADSKAGFIAAFNVLLFGFVANHMDKLRTLWNGKSVGTGVLVFALVLVGIYVASMVVTFGLVVSCVISRFGGRAPQGRVFFAHIAAQYGKNHKRYAQDIGAMTNADWVEELGSQVVEVSRLAILKHKRVRWAACCTLVSVLLWIISLVTLVSIVWMQGP